MANVLERIVADKETEIAKRQQEQPLQTFIDKLEPSDRDFYGALASSGTQFILECKKASPSKGLIREDFNLHQICETYTRYATCISVLTDEKYFQGQFAYLSFVRQRVSQPVLCKDFFISEYQVYLARYHGADAILLMLSVLNDQAYQKLAKIAETLNMSVLTEVSNREEVERALALDATIIGINNRNLRDLSTDLSTTETLRVMLPDDKLVISESGIYTHQDVKRLAPRCNGFLVGSALMAQDHLERACRALIFGENKVCGLRRGEDALAAYQAGAIYGGLIFYPKSPRYLDLKQAKQVITHAPLSYVGVFVNADIEQVVDYAIQLQLSVIQLHGQESQDYIDKLRQQLPKNCQIWKAQAVKDQCPKALLNVDRHLYDTHSEQLSGGTGQVFDWSLLRQVETPFMLAGGLNVDNVKGAIQIGAIGLDLNSGVESKPGEKCAEKLAQLFTKIRDY